MRIPDPVERMESRIESNIEAAFKGVSPGQFRCIGCDGIFPEDEMQTFSASPDSPAGCGKCTGFDEWCAKQPNPTDRAGTTPRMAEQSTERQV